MNNLTQKKSTILVSLVPLLISMLFILLELKYAAALMLTGLSAVYIFFRHAKYGRTFLYLVLGALFLRVFLVLLNESFGFLPEQADASQYTRQAMKVLDNISRQLPLFNEIPYSNSVKSYAFILSQFYVIVGEMPLFAQVVNVILGVLSAIVVFKISLLIFGREQVARLAMIGALFLPTIIAFTSYVLRDSLVMYLTLLMLYNLISMETTNRRLYHGLFALILFVLVGIIRIQNLYLYTLFFLSFYFYKYLKSNSKRISKVLVVAFLLTATLIVFITFQDFIVKVFTYPLRAQPLRATGGSAYLQDMQYNSLFDIFKYLPIRFIYFTFGPFLWHVNSSFLLLAALEGFLVIAAFILTVQYFRKYRIDSNFDAQLLLVLFCLIGLLANSMVDSNFGTSVRHRMNYIIFFFIFAAACLRNFKFRFL